MADLSCPVDHLILICPHAAGADRVICALYSGAHKCVQFLIAVQIRAGLYFTPAERIEGWLGDNLPRHA